MKVLRVGDPHVKVSNLEEAGKLMQFVLDTAIANKVDRIEILGDLFHTHAVLRLEVLEFWNTWLSALSEQFQTVVLVGNHDMSGDFHKNSHSLSVFKNIADRPLGIVESRMILGNIGYLPYIHDPEKFVKEANDLAAIGAKVIVCHQTFNGAKYENGFYAPDGVVPTLINCSLIISGHIHARQRFLTDDGQWVIYPGTAKWDSNSDANQEKGLWIVNHDDKSGAILEESFVSTAGVCTPILSVVWKEGEESPAIPEGYKVNVELVGSSDWIVKQKKGLKGKVSVSAKITDQKKTEGRKTGTSLEDFIKNVYAGQSDKDKLLSYMKELNLV